MLAPSRSFRLLAALGAATLPSTTALAQKPAAPPPGFDAYVAQVLKAFTVPGAAVAIVKDGKVVLAKGYGVRRLGEPDAGGCAARSSASPPTRSCSPPRRIGLLVEEGKLEWDAPVIRYLPWFAMYDPFVTRELTVRDLLVHRSGLGLGAGDLLWWPPSTYDREGNRSPAPIHQAGDLVPQRLRLRQRPLSRCGRGDRGGLAARAGRTSSAPTSSEVGMTDSDVYHSAASRAGNVATPHAEVNDTVRPVAPFLSDNTNPAGGVMSGAEDIAKWLIVQLDSGRVGRRVATLLAREHAAALAEVTPEPIGEPVPGLEHLRPSFYGYALGVETRDYRGKQMLTHTGGLPGYVSRLAMIPELRLGVAVLTNQESGLAFNAIVYRALDHYLGAKPPDYIGIYGGVLAQNRSKLAQLESSVASERGLDGRAFAAAERSMSALPRHLVRRRERHSGGRRPRHPHDADAGLVGDLRHWQHDTFIARWRDRELRADAFVTFALNPDGSIDQVKMAPTSPAVDFSFDFQDLLLRPVVK